MNRDKAIAAQRRRVVKAFNTTMEAFAAWGCLAEEYVPGGEPMEDDQYTEVADRLVYDAWVIYQNLYNAMIGEDGPWELDAGAADLLVVNPDWEEEI